MRSSLDYYNGTSVLSFPCEDNVQVSVLGLEPNGYFWESVATYLAPELVEEVELDSEADLFTAVGTREALEQLQTLIEPFLQDPELTLALAREAQASGFVFDC